MASNNSAVAQAPLERQQCTHAFAGHERRGDALLTGADAAGRERRRARRVEATQDGVVAVQRLLAECFAWRRDQRLEHTRRDEERKSGTTWLLLVCSDSRVAGRQELSDVRGLHRRKQRLFLLFRRAIIADATTRDFLQHREHRRTVDDVEIDSRRAIRCG
jgi:hypothetical protein